MCLDPGQRALHVDDVGRPLGGRAQAVVDGGHHPPALREVADQRQRLPAFLADHPGTAVDVQQHRAPRHDRAGGAHDVELVEVAMLAIGDVGEGGDALALEVQRARPLAHRDARSQQRGALGQDALPVISAQGLLQRTLQRRPVAPGAAVRQRHRQRRHKRERRAELTRPRRQATQRTQQGAADDRDRHQRHGQFCAHQAEGEPVHGHRVLGLPAPCAGHTQDGPQQAPRQPEPGRHAAHGSSASLAWAAAT
jgi:hypothetical protein